MMDGPCDNEIKIQFEIGKSQSLQDVPGRHTGFCERSCAKLSGKSFERCNAFWLPQHNDKTYGLRDHAKLKSFFLSLIPTQPVAENKHDNHPLAAAEDVVGGRLLAWHEMMRSRWCGRCGVKKIQRKERCQKDPAEGAALQRYFQEYRQVQFWGSQLCTENRASDWLKFLELMTSTKKNITGTAKFENHY